MNHYASPEFWASYRALPAEVQALLADKSLELLKSDSRHPSLHFKRVGEYRSVRVGLHYRALGIEVADACLGSGSEPMPSTIDSLANPAFNRTRRSAQVFRGGRQWRRAG